MLFLNGSASCAREPMVLRAAGAMSVSVCRVCVVDRTRQRQRSGSRPTVPGRVSPLVQERKEGPRRRRGLPEESVVRRRDWVPRDSSRAVVLSRSLQ